MAALLSGEEKRVLGFGTYVAEWGVLLRSVERLDDGTTRVTEWVQPSGSRAEAEDLLANHKVSDYPAIYGYGGVITGPRTAYVLRVVRRRIITTDWGAVIDE